MRALRASEILFRVDHQAYRDALASFDTSEEGQAGSVGESPSSSEEGMFSVEYLRAERYEQCSDIFHGFDWSAWTSSSPAARLSVLPAAQEHVLAQESGKERLLQVVTELSKAFALAVPHDEAIRRGFHRRHATRTSIGTEIAVVHV